MKKILIFTTSMIFLIGCGGGSSSSGSNKDVTMTIGQPYTVYSGNKIIKNAEETHVQVTHIDGESESTVVLVEGNATIIRKP
jgi:hypothetical protein